MAGWSVANEPVPEARLKHDTDLKIFIGLFLIVDGAENAGIIQKLLGFAQHWNLQRLGVFTVVVGLLSNVPAVMLVKSLVPGFADPHTAWLELDMASTLAGNLTITGSVAKHHRGGNCQA